LQLNFGTVDLPRGTDYSVPVKKRQKWVDPLAFLDESQESYRKFAKQRIRELGGPPTLSLEELRRRLTRALKGHRSLSQEIIRMREE
jgi:hypothetical protein